MNRILALSTLASGLRTDDPNSILKVWQNKANKIKAVPGPVTYIASLEGDLNQLVLSLETSNYLAVTWHGDHEFKKVCDMSGFKGDYNMLNCWPQLRFKGNEGRFVFGGNLFDWGYGDIRSAHMMVDFYEACKTDKQCNDQDDDEGNDRIYFIMGNRDILKMRYAVENVEAEAKAAWWNRKPKQQDMSWRQFQLAKTAGAPESFDARKKELELLGLDDDGTVKEQEVADSFLWMTYDEDKTLHHENVTPLKGLYNKYLDLADLIVKIDDTVYMQGSVTKENFLQVPKFETADIAKWNKHHDKNKAAQLFDAVESVNDWIKELRDFDDQMVDDWQAAIKNNQDMPADSFAGKPLSIYMMWTAVGNRTVVETSIMVPFELNIIDIVLVQDARLLLTGTGIRRVVGGHRPSGKQPVSTGNYNPHHKTIEFFNMRTTFDNLVNGRKMEGRVSKRGGWSRLLVDNGTAEMEYEMPASLQAVAAGLNMIMTKN